MPKLILRCNYLKNSPPAHLANYINYIGTREGVEKVASTTSSLPATDRQKSLIEDILAKIPDANRMHEYHDYIQRPTRENASEFITQALEKNLDIIKKKKNWIKICSALYKKHIMLIHWQIKSLDIINK